MPMIYDVLKLNYPEIEQLPAPDLSSVSYNTSPIFDYWYDNRYGFGEREEDFWNSLNMFCCELEQADGKQYFLEHSSAANRLTRHADNLFCALEQSHMLEPVFDKEDYIDVNSDVLHTAERIEAEKYDKVSKTAYFVLEALCYYGEYKWVADFVRNYFLRFLDEDNNLKLSLNYHDLFLKVGDICLFYYNNFYFAKEYYTLAALNWTIEAEENSDEHRTVTESEKFLTILAEDVNDTWFSDKEELTKYFYPLIPIPNDRNFWSKEFDTFTDKLIDLARIVIDPSTKERFEQLTKELQDAYEDIKQKAKQKPCNKISVELRVSTGIYLDFRDEILLRVLLQLAGESKQTKEKYCSDVLLCFIQNALTQYEDLLLFQEYVSEKVISYRDWIIAKEMNLQLYQDEYEGLLQLVVFYSSVQKILKHLKVPVDETTRIAYYTPYDSFGHMFWKDEEKKSNFGRLPLMHVAYMNDPNEGRILINYLTESSPKADVRKDLREQYVYLKCFTDQIDDLPMWEMYGDGAKGLCVVLNGYYRPGRPERDKDGKSSIIPGRRDKLNLYHVLYMKKNGSQSKYELIADYNTTISSEKFDTINATLSGLKATMPTDIEERIWYVKCMAELRYLFKDADYYHENETRIISIGTPGTYELTKTTDPPLLYQYLEGYPEIDEVVVGPKFEDRPRKVMYMQAKIDDFYYQPKINMEPPKITFSTIDYR